VCESHGATFEGRRLGSFGWVSNFSFYYAHHLSTIEGGMVCTDDEDIYETVRMLRSHGMVRELSSQSRKEAYWKAHPDLNPDFIFVHPAWNVRSTEINAVIGCRSCHGWTPTSSSAPSTCDSSWTTWIRPPFKPTSRWRAAATTPSR